MINNKPKNNPFQCLGICQRLFDFMFNNFLPKRSVVTTATSRRSMRQGSPAVPIFSATPPASWNKIEYHKAQTRAQFEESAQVKLRRPGPAKTVRFMDDGGCYYNDEEEERVRERKGKSVVVSSERVELEDVKLRNDPSPRSPPPAPPRQRQVRPLFDVAVNINEKSDAFIRSRKEAMRRNYSLET